VIGGDDFFEVWNKEGGFYDIGGFGEFVALMGHESAERYLKVTFSTKPSYLTR